MKINLCILVLLVSIPSISFGARVPDLSPDDNYSRQSRVPSLLSDDDYSSQSEDEYFEDIQREPTYHHDFNEQTLIDAVTHGSADELISLYSEGADYHWVDPSSGESLMHMAALYGQVENLHFLIRIGLNINIQNNLGVTPLMNAVSGGSLATVKFLVQQGANLNQQNHEGNRAINYAIEAGSQEMIKYLRNSMHTKSSRSRF